MSSFQEIKSKFLDMNITVTGTVLDKCEYNKNNVQWSRQNGGHDM